MFKAVIFDLDGTLLNTLDDLSGSCNHALHTYGFPTHEKDEYKNFLGGGLYNLMKRALPPGYRDDDFNKVLAEYRRYYALHSVDNTVPYEGIVPMLQKLKTYNLLLAVASNKSDEFLGNIVAKYFAGIFDIVEGRKDERPVKPDPAILFDIMKALGVNADEVLYVGDSDADMQAAYQAKVKSAGVLWGFRSEQELRGNKATYIAKNADDLVRIICGQLSEADPAGTD